MNNVRWKPVTNFKKVMNNLYEVSDSGDVRFILTKEPLHQKIANKKHHPYRAVYLKHTTGKSEWILVHQLVATFFVKIPDELLDVPDLVPDHLDNDGLNNHYSNLEWKTRGKNVSDAFKFGYCDNSGERNKGTFITEDQAHQICNYIYRGYSYDVILDNMNFPHTKKYRQLLIRIKNGLAWKKVSSQYDINQSMVRYTEAQRKTIKNIPKIIRLLSQGKNTVEVAKEVYGDEFTKSKISTVRLIRDKKLFTELLDDEGNYTKLIII